MLAGELRRCKRLKLKLCWATAAYAQDYLNATHFARDQPYLNAVGMLWRISQDVFDDTARALAAALMLFLNDFDLKAGPDMLAGLTIHK